MKHLCERVSGKVGRSVGRWKGEWMDGWLDECMSGVVLLSNEWVIAPRPSPLKNVPMAKKEIRVKNATESCCYDVKEASGHAEQRTHQTCLVEVVLNVELLLPRDVHHINAKVRTCGSHVVPQHVDECVWV